jgi:small-conductance mechanosensitive channel
MIVGGVAATLHGNIRTGSFDHRLVALIGIFIFLLFANLFLQTLTRFVFVLFTKHHLSVGRAGALKFFLQIVGYVMILLMTLDLVGISVAKLLLGSAVIGIILGVAAQQALANFFASIVIIFAHPFSIGEDIVLYSGTFGGKYYGRVMDIGLTHTRLKDEEGNIVHLPNATILASAAITKYKPKENGPAPKSAIEQ